jgi:aminoglycoside phosphotransferase (APT) family kinase protein
MHADEVDVDEPLVRRLLAEQLPELAGLPMAIVEPWGTDNAIWRLGSELVIRLPRIHWARRQVGLEAEWLPRLAPHLPVDVPQPVHVGQPSEHYPYAWSVHRWVHGAAAEREPLGEPVRFATDLAGFVRALRRIPTEGAPPARGRARPLEAYDDATRRVIHAAAHLIDAAAAVRIWDEALAAAPHPGPPVWVHGDLEGNCLVSRGRLCGVVDWGSACAGDPAVDVQVVWSPLFTERSRHAFLELLDVDHATVLRSRGAALNQACAALPYYLDTYPEIVHRSRHKLRALGVDLLDDPSSTSGSA